MNGDLIKTDASGNIMWSNNYSFPYYGLSTVKQLPSGKYITGGTYHVCDMYTLFERDYSAFISVLDSSGNGVLQTTSYIWPGDANHNDSIYFAEDILYTALAFGNTGPAIDTLAPNFYPVFWEKNNYAVDWLQSFPNGVNYKHADYNGDGAVDITDINSLLNSAGLFLTPTPVFYRNASTTFSTQPVFILKAEKDTVAPGDLMRFYIVAGNNFTPVDSVYGIAFSSHYDESLTDTSLVNINFTVSDFGIPGTNLLAADKNYVNGGEMYFVISRTDNQNVYLLNDTLGVIELKANAGITTQQTLDLQITSFESITHNTSKVLFNSIGGSVIIDPNLLSIKENQNTAVKVYPNPADKYLFVNDLSKCEKQISIYNLLGEKIKNIYSSASNLKIPVSNLQSGIYNLIISSNEELIHTKFLVRH